MAPDCPSLVSSPTTTATSLSPGPAVACKWDDCNQHFQDLRALCEHLFSQHVGWQPESWPWGTSISENGENDAGGIAPMDLSLTSACQSMSLNTTRQTEDMAAPRQEEPPRQENLEGQSRSIPSNVEMHDNGLDGDEERMRNGSGANADTDENKPCPPSGAVSSPNSVQNPTALPSIIELFSSVARGSLEQSLQAKESAKRKRGENVKVRRKWSEEETRFLLRGIEKHGLGNWKAILNDEEFEFNQRTAMNLKDRFRTCYPAGLPTESLESQNSTPVASEEEDCISSSESHTLTARGASDANSSKTERRYSLDVSKPLKKSRRRERRPFVERDDNEILEGLRRYGPAWAKIQRHPTFHLADRRPMDLRDRIRNRFPDLYKCLAKNITSQQQKEAILRSNPPRRPPDGGG